MFKAFKNPKLSTSIKSSFGKNEILSKLKLKSGLKTPSILTQDGLSFKNKAGLTSKFLQEKKLQLFKDLKQPNTDKSETSKRYPTRTRRYKQLFENIGIGKNLKKPDQNDKKSIGNRSNHSGKKSSRRIKIKLNQFPLSRVISPTPPTNQPIKTSNSSMRRIIKNSSNTISQHSNQSIRKSSKVQSAYNRTLNASPYEHHEKSSKSSLKYKNSIIDSLIRKKIDENTIVSSTNSLNSKVSKNRSKSSIPRPNSNNDFVGPVAESTHDAATASILSKTTRHKAIKIRCKLQQKSKQFNTIMMNTNMSTMPVNVSSEEAYQNTFGASKPMNYFSHHRGYSLATAYNGSSLNPDQSVEVKLAQW